MTLTISPETILKKSSTPISLEQANKNGHVLIDVRSSQEFEDGTIIGAQSIPIFDNYERSVIGTIYKHGSKQQAVAKGFEFVKQKFPELLESFVPFKGKTITIFCAKGGMRSRSIVNLLSELRYEVYQLEGGYKQYRNDTLDYLSAFKADLIVLHGMTGTGKTRIIEAMDHSIDLEGLAQHRSSLFGGINTIPRNQKQFESFLISDLKNLQEPPYFIEGESTKLGAVFLPKSVAYSMQKGRMIKVNASLETRIERIIEDYPIDNDTIRKRMEGALLSLKRRLGKSTVDKLLSHLEKNELEQLVHILLTEYYDKRYGNMYKKYDFCLEISSENIDDAVQQLYDYRLQLLSS